MKTSALLVCFVAIVSSCSAFGKSGILGSSREEVEGMLGPPTSQEHGKLVDIEFDRYHYETRGWKTAVLFIEGKAQKFETEKSDGSPLNESEQRVILEGYDLPDTDENSKIRGWRTLSENHLIRGDGRVHVIKHPASMTIFLDDLPRDFW
jgi:hypothetical protein